VARWSLALAIAALSMALLLLPEMIFLPNRWPANLLGKEYVFLFLCCLLLSCSGKGGFVAGFVTVIGCMALSEIAHFIYFGRLLSPISVKLIFKEWAEIIHTGSASSYLIAVVLTVLFAYGTVIAILVRFKQYLPSFPKLSALCLLAVLVSPFIQVSLRNDILFYASRNYYPVPIRALYTYAVATRSWLTERKCPPALYQAPSFTVHEPQPRDVVVLMGESLSPNHMSVLGYHRNTTPWLNEQSINAHPNNKFKAGLAIAAGVATRSTFPLFFNAVNDPTDRDAVAGGATNLFQLARKNGFASTLITAQSEELMQGVDLSGVQIMELPKSDAISAKKKDVGLLDLLDQVPSAQRRFIVIQFRAPHSPYAEHTKQRPDLQRFTSALDTFREREIADYDNALLLVDEVAKGVVQRVGDSVKPAYVLLTSDHAELLDSEGRWGHSLLDLDVAQVPLILWAPKNDRQFWSWAKRHPVPAHYDIAREIAQLLGFNIRNSTETAARFVNGPASFGVDGYFRWTLVDGYPFVVERLSATCVDSPR